MQVPVNVSIADTDHFEGVVEAAQKAGLVVHRRLDLLGVATGTIEEASLGRLSRVPGVGRVERAREVSVPQPVGPRRY